MAFHVESLVRALWRPMLLRGIGFWFGVRAMLAMMVLIFRIPSVEFPSLLIPATVAGLAFAHSVAMKETIYYRNLGIRWFPSAMPALVATSMEFVIALVAWGV